MINILEHPNEDIKANLENSQNLNHEKLKLRCSYCKALFSFHKDIDEDEIDFVSSMELINIKYIMCPCCGTRLITEKLIYDNTLQKDLIVKEQSTDCFINDKNFK